MQITRVELTNIKNHAKADWTFLPGVVAICGPNGSGKTTILEAIAWALFDHLDYKREDFVKRGEKKGLVAVSFISDLDQREYTVQRDTSGTYFVYDPMTKLRLVELKNQVLPWLCQHIGVEATTDLASLFKTTIGVPQGTFTYDFTLRPSERKSVFDRILKVDEYREASDKLRGTLRHLEGRLAEADRGIAAAEGELKAANEIEREANEMRDRQNRLQNERKQAVHEQNHFTQKVAQLDELQRQIETQRGTSERLKIRLQLMRDKLSVAHKIAEQSRAAAALVETARSGYESYLAATQMLAELEHKREERDALRYQLSEIERAQIEIRTQLSHYQKDLTKIDEARAEFAQLAEKIREQHRFEARLAELHEERGARQSLEQSLAQLDKELERLRQHYSALSRELEKAESQRSAAELAGTLEEEYARLNGETSQYEVTLKSLEFKREHLEQLCQELKRLDEESERNVKELTYLQSLATIGARVTTLESDHQRQMERFAQLQAEVARDSEMIAGLESGGICPLLTEKCLNLQPGESLDHRFRNGLEARRNEIKRLEATIPKLASELKSAQLATAEIARLPRVQAETERLSHIITAQQEQIATIDKEIAASSATNGDELEELKKRQREIDIKLRAARAAQQAYAQAEILRRELEAVKDEGEAKKRSRDEIDARIKGFCNLETQIEETDTAWRALADPRGRATVLEQQIARTDELRIAIAQAEREAMEITTQLQSLTTKFQTYATLDEQLTAATQARIANEPDYRAFIANEQSAAVAEARKQEAIQIAVDVAETEMALTASQTELERLSAQYDAGHHMQTRNDLDQWRHRTTQIATQLEHTLEQLSRLEKQLTYLDEVRVRMQSHLAEREGVVRLEETADFVRDVLQKAAPYITESYLFSISLESNQLFREITGRYDVTLRWTKDYEITLEEEGRERPFGNLSGGEQMAAALAVRLALLKELSEVNLAFFDEPTTNMDEERRRNLAQQIGRIKDFHQLFVISHDDSFEGYTDQIIVLGKHH